MYLWIFYEYCRWLVLVSGCIWTEHRLCCILGSWWSQLGSGGCAPLSQTLVDMLLILLLVSGSWRRGIQRKNEGMRDRWLFCLNLKIGCSHSMSMSQNSLVTHCPSTIFVLMPLPGAHYTLILLKDAEIFPVALWLWKVLNTCYNWEGMWLHSTTVTYIWNDLWNICHFHNYRFQGKKFSSMEITHGVITLITAVPSMASEQYKLTDVLVN